MPVVKSDCQTLVRRWIQSCDNSNIGTLGVEYNLCIHCTIDKTDSFSLSSMQFSDFGRRFRGGTGIAELMHDLATSTAGNQPVYRLGGGNPANIPAMTHAFGAALSRFSASETAFSKVASTYPSAQGDQPFIESLARLFRRECHWPVAPENIALTNGSQNAFFMLFNLFGGATGGRFRRILLPMAPEYIGYEDVSIGEPLFISRRPLIDELPDQQFKYRLDKQQLQVDDDIAAICVSRPTNPTGNVLTDQEVQHLDTLATQHKVPLIIDNAYGAPFPNIINVEANLHWHDNIVLSMSLSKLGLPGVRTGIVVAHRDIIDALTQMNAVMNLSPGALGAGIMQPLFDSGEVLGLCQQHIQPFYQQRAVDALTWFRQAFDGLPALVHKPEGSIFLWLWFPEIAITSGELYQRLKKRGVIIVPGHYFFPGLDEQWPHKQQCIRVNVGGDANDIRAGLNLIADEIRRVS